ncbi:MAG: 23S rRNA (guanosine(2251)-2'-O)-methyltransferase RlmB [Actinobacteria bacterium]|nr:23S rRNA (guanosine(2251)-2'-O)-methyltransferase RlmB [Actinomycetota bacterium]
METVEGRRTVYELLRSAGRVEKILIAKESKSTDILDKIEALARKQGVRIDTVDKDRLDDIAGSRVHQGVIAYISAYEYLPFSEFCSRLDITAKPVVLLLDGVTDPQNFGALIRSADATGAAGVVVTKRRSAPVTAAVHKASAGATAYVDITQVSNLSYAIDELKEMGFWVVGASEKAGRAYYDIDFNMPLVVVLGSEGGGLSRLVAEKCDFLAAIPMRGEISSLNVSVAGAVLLYEALRQRRVSGEPEASGKVFL